MNHKKTILITGINKGIGKGLAEKFIELGYKVIGTTRKQCAIEGLSQLYQLDLTDYKNIEQTADLLTKNGCKIDILINNAGIGSDYNETLSKQDNFELRFKTHVFGTFFFTESILDLIQNQGKIVNISSKLSSFDAIKHIDKCKLSLPKMAYIMSKASLNTYTQLLSNRLKERGVEVLSIHPGWVKTSLSKTNKNAPMDIKASVNGIVQLIEQPKDSGSFWDAETQLPLKW